MPEAPTAAAADPAWEVPLGTTHACQACGAPVEAADPFCQACGTQQATPAQDQQADEPAQKHFECQNCGARMAADHNQRSYTCPFCDSNYVVEFQPELTGKQPPEFVIGFAVTREQAEEKFRTWLADNAWFRPGDLRQASAVEKMQGIYLPFWSFSMLANSRWSARIGEHWYRTETYTTIENGKTVTRTRQVQETEWWPLSGEHHDYHSGYLVTGSKSLGQADAERIKPFRLEGLKRYRPSFLAGWLSEEYVVERAAALSDCQQVFFAKEQQAVRAFLPGDTASDVNVDTDFSHVESDLCLLPVYLMTYRYQDKLYRFLVNGQTGRLDGDKPTSWQRIATAVTVLLIMAAVIGLALSWLNR